MKTFCSLNGVLRKVRFARLLLKMYTVLGINVQDAETGKYFTLTNREKVILLLQQKALLLPRASCIAINSLGYSNRFLRTEGNKVQQISRPIVHFVKKAYNFNLIIFIP